MKITTQELQQQLNQIKTTNEEEQKKRQEEIDNLQQKINVLSYENTQLNSQIKINQQQKGSIPSLDSSINIFEIKARIEDLDNNVVNLSKLLNEEKIKNKALQEELTSKIKRLNEIEKNLLNTETRKLLFNYVALGVKLMNASNSNKNTNLTDFYVDMEAEGVPICEWPMWINSQIEHTETRPLH
ncbi:hypothetical protein EDI_300090 [Entamoeba dispar SAW760]|nr:uncharacterized protein EDI_300090 [Entamoeba dispar SAW760]EDR22587.1 hypothetical protein EDI_300090 [Entamoeba dispar SAW760]|eukprot:EDR22587.1 hypothetical protein EDI_300090 [Entamoeba dispar SAW760]